MIMTQGSLPFQYQSEKNDSLRHEVATQTVAADSNLHATYCSVSSSLPEHAIGVIRWCEASETMMPRETVDESASEMLAEENALLREENQSLRDEINRLK